MLSIALPTGRLSKKAYKLFAQIGCECPEMLTESRKLVMENAELGIRYLLVKPSDVPIYVEHGAADIGIAGRDVLLEYNPDVYELLDLKIGVCTMCVAVPSGYTERPDRILRVATKYPRTADSHYTALNRRIEIIKLNGSIELAPILGLSDVIVDIVETGTTLRENDLVVTDKIHDISARLIANKSAYNFKGERIDSICAGLKSLLEE